MHGVQQVGPSSLLQTAHAYQDKQGICKHGVETRSGLHWSSSSAAKHKLRFSTVWRPLPWRRACPPALHTCMASCGVMKRNGA